MSDNAVVQRVGQVAVFAEVETNPKDLLILALREAGKVVG